MIAIPLRPIGKTYNDMALSFQSRIDGVFGTLTRVICGDTCILCQPPLPTSQCSHNRECCERERAKPLALARRYFCGSQRRLALRLRQRNGIQLPSLGTASRFLIRLTCPQKF